MSQKPVSERARRFGIAIRKLRIEKRRTQDDFADLVGNNRSYHGEIERGETSVSLEKVSSMAEKLGLKTSEFIKKLEDYGY